MRVPEPVAHQMTGRVQQSLRGYFLGVTIVALFNAVVVTLGALILGVPLKGTIAAVTFLGAYIPTSARGAPASSRCWSRSAAAAPTRRIGMAVVQLLANGILAAAGAAGRLRHRPRDPPARGPGRDDRRRQRLRRGRPRASPPRSPRRRRGSPPISRAPAPRRAQPTPADADADTRGEGCAPACRRGGGGRASSADEARAVRRLLPGTTRADRSDNDGRVRGRLPVLDVLWTMISSSPGSCGSG